MQNASDVAAEGATRRSERSHNTTTHKKLDHIATIWTPAKIKDMRGESDPMAVDGNLPVSNDSGSASAVAIGIVLRPFAEKASGLRIAAVPSFSNSAQ